MSRLRGVGTLGCIIALAFCGCAGPQHRTSQSAVMPWDEPVDPKVHGPNDLFTPQPQPASGLSRYFPRLAKVAQARERAALQSRDRHPAGLLKGPARLDGPEPIRSDEPLEGGFDLQARATESAPRLPVTMMAPVSPQSVADAELDADSDGVVDRLSPPFRAKDDRAARQVQARGRDLQEPRDPFGNLDRFAPPAAVAWPEPGPNTTLAAIAETHPEGPAPSAVPTDPADDSDPFADLRLPPIPTDLAQPEPESEAMAPEPAPSTVTQSATPAQGEPVQEVSLTLPVPPTQDEAETFTQDVGSASDPFAGLKIPPPPMDVNLFEPVPAGRPRMQAAKPVGTSMYAPSVRRVADFDYDLPGLSGRPRAPQRPDDASLPPATFPPTYYDSAETPPAPVPVSSRQPVPPPSAEPAPHKRWLIPRLFKRLRDRNGRPGQEMQAPDYPSAYDSPLP